MPGTIKPERRIFMRKIIKNTIIVIMAIAVLKTCAFGLEVTGEVHKNVQSEGTALSFIYQGFEKNAQETLLVYDATETEELKISSQIKDIIQKQVNGKFYYEIDPEFSGMLMLKIGGTAQNESLDILLTIENGSVLSMDAPKSELTEQDAMNDIWTLKEEEILTLDNGIVLKNCIIDASCGGVIYGSTSITGKMEFNEEGQLDAKLGRVISLKAPTDDGKNNYGFLTKQNIEKLTLNEETNKRSYVFEITDGEKTYSKTIEFDNIYSGNARLGLGIKNVPSGIDLAVK